MPQSLFLTSPQVLWAVERLEGERLPARTLAEWAANGTVVPDVWPRNRGRYNVRLYSLLKLAQARTAVRLRRIGFSLEEVRNILRQSDVRDALRPSSRDRAELVIEGRRVFVRRPGDADREVPTGQLMIRFPVADVFMGNQEVAERARTSA